MSQRSLIKIEKDKLFKFFNEWYCIMKYKNDFSKFDYFQLYVMYEETIYSKSWNLFISWKYMENIDVNSKLRLWRGLYSGQGQSPKCYSAHLMIIWKIRLVENEIPSSSFSWRWRFQKYFSSFNNVYKQMFSPLVSWSSVKFPTYDSSMSTHRLSFSVYIESDLSQSRNNLTQSS